MGEPFVPDSIVHWIPGCREVTLYRSYAGAIMDNGVENIFIDSTQLSDKLSPRKMQVAYNDLRCALTGYRKAPAQVTLTAINAPGILAGKLWSLLQSVGKPEGSKRVEHSFTIYTFDLARTASIADNGERSPVLASVRVPKPLMVRLRAFCRVITDLQAADYSETELRIAMFGALADGKLNPGGGLDRGLWAIFSQHKSVLVRSGALRES
jgi:hypothetical protein